MRARKRARNADRDQAVDLLNAGYADGRLTATEREDRVGRALAAKTLGDLAQVTSDLETEPASTPTTVEREGLWRRTPRRTKLVLAGIVLATVVGGTAVEFLDDDGGSVAVQQDASYAVPASADGVADLIAAQEAEFGTTKSYGISLQRDLTTLDVPSDDGRARFRSWRPLEEGGFEPGGEVRGAGEYREFDLADVDVAALRSNIATAREELGVPEPSYLVLVVQHWAEDEQPRVVISVVNEFDESGYLVTDLAGSELGREAFGS